MSSKQEIDNNSMGSKFVPTDLNIHIFSNNGSCDTMVQK
jgi:hypothetical protein